MLRGANKAEIFEFLGIWQTIPPDIRCPTKLDLRWSEEADLNRRRRRHRPKLCH